MTVAGTPASPRRMAEHRFAEVCRWLADYPGLDTYDRAIDEARVAVGLSPIHNCKDEV